MLSVAFILLLCYSSANVAYGVDATAISVNCAGNSSTYPWIPANCMILSAKENNFISCLPYSMNFIVLSLNLLNREFNVLFRNA
eukprot:snap_masked-scaffold_1-processed-gene-18.25-mRNA-1 protein AED:1.00 eAED:1.00 QI:0/0/0/0/1/1/2/0/83